MISSSIGDLARGFAMKRQSAALKETLTRLGGEVSTGRVTDPVARLDGNLSRLSQIERDLTLAAGFRDAAAGAGTDAQAMQFALQRVTAGSDRLLSGLTLSGTDAGRAPLTVIANEARASLEGMVAALGVRVAGRHLFAGAAVGRTPLAPASEIVSRLRDAIAAARTPAEALAAADGFFLDPGGGFETGIYRGSAEGLAPIPLGAGEHAVLSLRADDPALRDTLKYTALAALADDPALVMDDAMRRGLLDCARDGLSGAREAQTALQAQLGTAESDIARARARIGAETSALEIARAALLGVDPYRAATELEAARLQLETVYTVTARLSHLSLVNFLS